MVFGGVDTRLHTSPMIFVHGLKATGWYKVHMTGIWIRKGGGEGVMGDEGQQVTKVTANVNKLNSGKVRVCEE